MADKSIFPVDITESSLGSVRHYNPKLADSQNEEKKVKEGKEAKTGLTETALDKSMKACVRQQVANTLLAYEMTQPGLKQAEMAEFRPGSPGGETFEALVTKIEQLGADETDKEANAAEEENEVDLDVVKDKRNQLISDHLKAAMIATLPDHLKTDVKDRLGRPTGDKKFQESILEKRATAVIACKDFTSVIFDPPTAQTIIPSADNTRIHLQRDIPLTTLSPEQVLEYNQAMISQLSHEEQKQLQALLKN